MPNRVFDLASVEQPVSAYHSRSCASSLQITRFTCINSHHENSCRKSITGPFRLFGRVAPGPTRAAPLVGSALVPDTLGHFPPPGGYPRSGLGLAFNGRPGCFSGHAPLMCKRASEPGDKGFFEASDLFAARSNPFERGGSSQLLAELTGQQIEPLWGAFRGLAGRLWSSGCEVYAENGVPRPAEAAWRNHQRDRMCARGCQRARGSKVNPPWGGSRQAASGLHHDRASRPPVLDAALSRQKAALIASVQGYESASPRRCPRRRAPVPLRTLRPTPSRGMPRSIPRSGRRSGRTHQELQMTHLDVLRLPTRALQSNTRSRRPDLRSRPIACRECPARMTRTQPQARQQSRSI